MMLWVSSSVVERSKRTRADLGADFAEQSSPSKSPPRAALLPTRRTLVDGENQATHSCHWGASLIVSLTFSFPAAAPSPRSPNLPLSQCSPTLHRQLALRYDQRYSHLRLAQVQPRQLPALAGKFGACLVEEEKGESGGLLTSAIATLTATSACTLKQSFLWFYDHVAKANWFLEQMIDLVDEPMDSRT